MKHIKNLKKVFNRTHEEKNCINYRHYRSRRSLLSATAFEEKLYEFFDANHKDLLNSLQSDYSDEIISSLKTALEKFKGVYQG